jgi:hypothetical protein
MARCQPGPAPTEELILRPVADWCVTCGGALRADYTQQRVVRTLRGVTRLRLQIRRCQDAGCARYHCAVRPEEEGSWVLPGSEFGLDVIARVGALRYREHRSVPEIRTALEALGVPVAERTVSNLLDRYDELLALRLLDNPRLQRILKAQKRVVLALDGLQPAVGHEVLWVVRDCVSGEVVRARSLLSARHADLVTLLQEVKEVLGVPIVGVVSDGERSIRKAVAQALPGVPHQLCQFHYLREAGRPLYEADRHAKKLLKKAVRGVRPIERKVEGREDRMAQVVRGYCAAVRSALTDDRRPPLGNSGQRLQKRLRAIEESLGRVGQRGPRSRS